MSAEAEELEMRAVRRDSPDLGIDALGNLQSLRERLADAVDVELYRVGADSEIEAIYIVGSFAAGNATRSISDLDVRIVISDPPPIDICENINERLRTEHGPDVIPGAAGFLDAHLATRHPEGCPHVRLLPCSGDSDD